MPQTSYGDLLDQLASGLDDPAGIFAQSVRLTGGPPGPSTTSPSGDSAT